MEQNLSLYERKGIDPQKSSVKEIFGKVVRNDFLGAWCNIVRDPERPGFVTTKHPDGPGSKTLQRILHCEELKQPEILQDDVFDGFQMNYGDIACSGFVDGVIHATQIVSVNKFRVDKELILRQNALGWVRLLEFYKSQGVNIIFYGGETADLPDQSYNYILDIDVQSSTKEENVIRGNITSRDWIWGFESTGRAIWETVINSGQMSNGLTDTRTELMWKRYTRKYPQLWGENDYVGRFKVNDQFPGLGMTVSEAILSTTRQWSIIIKMIIEEAKRRNAFHLIHGICMNTGGGLTKIKNLGQGIHYLKTIPFIAPYFLVFQKETGESNFNMMKTFNCGIGLEVVGSGKEGILEDILSTVSRSTNVQCYPLGECFYSNSPENKLTIRIGEDKEEYNY